MSLRSRPPSVLECCRRPARRFARSERGTAAVEFALLAVPFLGIVCATIETAVDYWAQSTLEAALTDASRAIYTGQFQAANGSKKSEAELLSALRTNLCTKNGASRATMFACQNVRLNVTTATSFAAASSTNPIKYDAATKQNDWNPDFGQYDCAGANAIVRVQAAVDFPVFFNLINFGSDRLSGNRRLLQAATVFRVEPYASTGACS